MLQKVEEKRRLFDITLTVMIDILDRPSSVVSEAWKHTVM